MNAVKEKKNGPAYLRLYRQLRDEIISGAFIYGARLPSKRLLAEENGVSTVTVEHAYALLCDEGYAEARERSGHFVIFRREDGFAASAPQSPSPPREQKESSSGQPDFPVSILSRTMRRVLTERSGVLLERSPNSGCAELREALRRYLARNRGMDVETEQIIIGSGSEYLYGLIVELLGRERVIAIESPSYQKIEQVYGAAEVKYELLPLAADGIDSAALKKSRADVLHTTPYRSFPSGVTASASKRHEYIRWAERPGRYIIEDDFESEFSVSTAPAETLFTLSGRGNVIYLNSFSRTISPSLRVGYMVLPRALVQPFERRLGFYSCTVPTFEQFVLAELIDSGDFERHINRVRRAKRRELAGKSE